MYPNKKKISKPPSNPQNLQHKIIGNKYKNECKITEMKINLNRKRHDRTQPIIKYAVMTPKSENVRVGNKNLT